MVIRAVGTLAFALAAAFAGPVTSATALCISGGETITDSQTGTIHSEAHCRLDVQFIDVNIGAGGGGASAWFFWQSGYFSGYPSGFASGSATAQDTASILVPAGRWIQPVVRFAAGRNSPSLWPVSASVQLHGPGLYYLGFPEGPTEERRIVGDPVILPGDEFAWYDLELDFWAGVTGSDLGWGGAYAYVQELSYREWPEPGGAWLLGPPLGALVLLRWRRRAGTPGAGHSA